jgi:UDP-N-acetylmuramoylalanine--D-glutamate ligase
LHHAIKGKNENTFLLGNYGKPALSYNSKSIKSIYILELSSYQIEYSKFLKFHACAVLNISPDHLERHKTFSNYINIKLKILDCLLLDGRGFVNKNFHYNNLIQQRKNVRKISNIKLSNIQNKFLLKENFLPSISIVFEILKFLKISNKLIIKSFNSFVPLPHRQELIKKIKNISFINDSKATNFDSANFSLKHYENIYWIACGLAKKNYKAIIDTVTKKKIIGTYLIGKNIPLFKQGLNMKNNYLICKTVLVAIHRAFRDAKRNNFKNSTILFSPAAAYFDQFRNFEDRGDLFKKIVKKLKNV